MVYVNPQRRKAASVVKLRKEAGQILKGMRERKGLTQRELAEKVGFDYYTFIAQIEAGRGRIPPERYGAYARALDMPSREFVRTLMKFYDPVTYSHLFGDGLYDPSGAEARKAL